MTEDTPVDEVTDQASQTGDPVAFDLREGHVDVLRGNLLSSVMKRLAEMLCFVGFSASGQLALRGPAVGTNASRGATLAQVTIGGAVVAFI